jgi:polyisoprenyl-phosphate glycosyltransferase
MPPALDRHALTVLIPVFNDWDSLGLLIPSLETVLRAEGVTASALVVDDGSTVPPPARLPGPACAITTVEILRLRRNLGHQRAIAIGLAFLHGRDPGRTVIVMDGDGEDRPSDIPALLRKFEEEAGQKTVFAARVRRSESVTFRLFYHLYRILHRLLTGVSVRVGNFSILPSSAIRSLVVVSELWNHYAAAVFKARLPYVTVPTSRGRRLSGQSRVDFVGLVMHGLSAISVFGDAVGTRLLAAGAAVMGTVSAALVAIVGASWLTPLVLPAWAAPVSLILLVILIQALTMSFLLAFIILASRAAVTFVPLRDYHYFILDVVTLPRV